MIADQWEIPRSELDELAVRSHALAHQATEEGRFEREIVPFAVNGDTYVTDQGIRPGTDIEKLAALKPAFKEDGKITAGNSLADLRRRRGRAAHGARQGRGAWASSRARASSIRPRWAWTR